MKYQVLFSLKSNDKIFKTLMCCCHDWLQHNLPGKQSAIDVEPVPTVIVSPWHGIHSEMP